MIPTHKPKKKTTKKRLADSRSTPDLSVKTHENGTDVRSDSPRLDPNSRLNSEVEPLKSESESAPPEVEPVAKTMSPAKPRKTKQLGKHSSSPKNKSVSLRSTTPVLIPKESPDGTDARSGSPLVHRNPPSPKRGSESEQSEAEPVTPAAKPAQPVTPVAKLAEPVTPVAKPAQPVSMSVEGNLSGENVVGRRALMFHLAALRQRRGS